MTPREPIGRIWKWYTNRWKGKAVIVELGGKRKPAASFAAPKARSSHEARQRCPAVLASIHEFGREGKEVRPARQAQHLIRILAGSCRHLGTPALRHAVHKSTQESKSKDWRDCPYLRR